MVQSVIQKEQILIQDPLIVVTKFIEALRKQTQGKLEDYKLNQIIMHGLSKGQDHILNSLFNEGVDLDLTNPDLSPDQLPGCTIF